MSTAARAAIAAAASTVDGIDVKPTYRQSVKAGDGMVRWERGFPAENGFGYMDVWQVLVAVPASSPDAERFLEDHRAPLIAALNPELVIVGIRPAEIVFDSGTTAPGFVIEGIRPTE